MGLSYNHGTAFTWSLPWVLANRTFLPTFMTHCPHQNHLCSGINTTDINVRADKLDYSHDLDFCCFLFSRSTLIIHSWVNMSGTVDTAANQMKGWRLKLLHLLSPAQLCRLQLTLSLWEFQSRSISNNDLNINNESLSTETRFSMYFKLTTVLILYSHQSPEERRHLVQKSPDPPVRGLIFLDKATC